MKKVLLVSLVFAFFLTACNKDENPTPTPQPDPSVTVELKNPINDFTWKAMNFWYNWQKNVSNLDDRKDEDQNDYHNFLNSYDTPQSLFESLLYQKGTIDRFSWFIEDYVVQQQAFQGITKSFGARYQLVAIEDDMVVIYVRYVSPNSPADRAGIKRGDIINAIDGIVMTRSNYRTATAKLSNESVTFSLVENDGRTKKEDKTITSEVVSDNPVYLTKVFEGVGGRRVGYLVYNGFRSSYNDELNAAFGELKAAGINELILDFRINGGGSVRTCSYLASMISASAGTDAFAELRFNSKNSNRSSKYYFENTAFIYDSEGKNTGVEIINRLSGLNRVYVLTSSSTASASEMIINGLRPFMTVKTVGTTTYGKNVGSNTLYDSPKSSYIHPKYIRDGDPEKQAILNEFNNKPHKNAMQPITFQIYNKLGQSDYAQGFNPDIEVVESDYWNLILPFGDENEVVLKAALNDIKGQATKTSLKADFNAKAIDSEFLDENKFNKEMYIEDMGSIK